VSLEVEGFYKSRVYLARLIDRRTSDNMVVKQRHIVGRHEEISVDQHHEHGSVDNRNT